MRKAEAVELFKRNFWRLLASYLATVILTIIAVISVEIWIIHNFSYNTYDNIRFLRAMRMIHRSYNGEVDSRQLFDGAIKGMVEAVGDPYTVYFNSKDFAEFSQVTEGTFGGIGVVFGKRGDDYVVISALQDNPGALAGIKDGDIIVSVDGVEAKTLNMEQMAHKIRGEKGTEVELELKDKSGELRKVRVIRKDIKATSVGGIMLPNTEIGYIRISMFNVDTGEDFVQTYKELEAKGMKALLLDLRSNPGGTLDSGVEVARMLVPKGPIVSIIDKSGNKFVESSTLEKVKYPMAVLVNGGTASAAEIVAGAIKDTKSGKLFGEKTFGKGCVQTVFPLDSETAVKITTAYYHTPSGLSIHNIGIEPDVKVELGENAVVDTQLKAAEKYLQELLQKKE